MKLFLSHNSWYISIHLSDIKYNIHYRTEINNEWNYFCPIIVGTFLYTFLILNITSIIGQKLTMNETIFCPIIVGPFPYTFLILNITTSIMKNKWNVNFLQNMRCVAKVSTRKLHLSRQKWAMNETLTSFKLVPLAFNNLFQWVFDWW